MDFEDIEWDEVDAAIAHEDAAQKAHAALVTAQGAFGPTWGCDELRDTHRAAVVATVEAVGHAQGYLRKLLPDLSTYEQVESLIAAARVSGSQKITEIRDYYRHLG